MRVLAIQLQVETGEVEANYERAYHLLERGARLYRPHVILFPEAFAVYLAWADMSFAEDVAEDVPGPTTDRFCQFSREYGALIAFGLVRRNPQGEGLFNSVVLADGGDIVGIYDKTHLVMDHRPATRALKNEQEMFLPGSRLGLFDTRFGKIGLLICHDGEYPEVWRCLALENAKAIFWLMNCGDLSTWAKLHARWNAIPVFTCNRVEVGEKGERRGGGSVLVDVHGEPFDAAGTAEAFVFADVDLEQQAQFRADVVTAQANVFRVRRTDLYGPICRPQ